MTEWHKSSFSPNGGNCVEAREHDRGADIRDTKNREAGFLSVDTYEWNALLQTVTR